MKTKRVITYLLVLVMAFLGFNFLKFKSNKNVYASYSPSSFSYYDQLVNDVENNDLTDDEKENIREIYNQILSAYLNGTLDGTTRITFSLPKSTSDGYKLARTAIKAVEYDYPEISLFDMFNSVYVGINTVTIGNTNYFENGITSKTQLNSMITSMREKRNYILNLVSSQPTIFDKIYYINEWLVENNDYNDYIENGGEDSSSVYAELCHTAYSALFNDNYEPVCDGYSYAFKYIMDGLGIPCAIVDGIYEQSTYQIGLHAWNEVYLYGNWYGVDVTFDDPIDEDSAHYSVYRLYMDNYLLLGDSNFYALTDINGDQGLTVDRRTILNKFIGNLQKTDEGASFTSYSYELIPPSISNNDYDSSSVEENQTDFTVTLNQNNGTNETEQLNVTYGEAMPEITTIPVRIGYIFLGYFDSLIGGIQYYNVDLTSTKNWDKLGDAILYAHWQEDETILPDETNTNNSINFVEVLQDNFMIILFLGSTVILIFALLVFNLKKKR